MVKLVERATLIVASKNAVAEPGMAVTNGMSDAGTCMWAVI